MPRPVSHRLTWIHRSSIVRPRASSCHPASVRVPPRTPSRNSRVDRVESRPSTSRTFASMTSLGLTGPADAAWSPTPAETTPEAWPSGATGCRPGMSLICQSSKRGFGEFTDRRHGFTSTLAVVSVETGERSEIDGVQPDASLIELTVQIKARRTVPIECSLDDGGDLLPRIPGGTRHSPCALALVLVIVLVGVSGRVGELGVLNLAVNCLGVPTGLVLSFTDGGVHLVE